MALMAKEKIVIHFQIKISTYYKATISNQEVKIRLCKHSKRVGMDLASEVANSTHRWPFRPPWEQSDVVWRLPLGEP